MSDHMDDYRRDFPHVVEAYERLNALVDWARKEKWDDVRPSLPFRVYEISKRLRGLMNVIRDYREAERLERETS